MCGFDSRWALLRSAYGKAWQFRLLRKQEIVGSNPTAPTHLRWSPRWYGQAPVKRPGTGSIPVTAAPYGRASQLAMAAVSKTVEPFDADATLNVTRANRPWIRCASRDAEKSLVSSTLTPSALRALDRAAEVPAFQAGEAGSTPAGHSCSTQLNRRR